ncbi:hypothetical protein [Paracoccus shanxieyensis]|uniref:hypothetical protein n=1 Tax=Paracoccus shanxieyensis TaxID=2675752 RepID=UPI0012B8D73C|nr:hypothetical protein [Paracoccus shanxieyensis]
MIGVQGEVGELGDAFSAKARRGRPTMLPERRKVRQNVMINPDVAERLEDLGNKSAFVNDALRKALG